MGTTGTSSKRKSSSSSSLKKKKRSKNLSQVQKKKRSRRNKSKKLHRRDDTIVYSDDDISKIALSISTSSSEGDDYRKRRSRSRNRRDVNKSKKRARRDSSSSSSESSPVARHVKKRKGAKKKVNLDMKKTTHRKKRKRDLSVSSRSCSTCNSSSDEESKFEKRRGRSDRKERGRSDRKERGKRDSGKRGIKKSRYRSRSPSCSRSSNGSGYQSEEKLVVVNNSRRLKSVITVVREEPEEKEVSELDRDVNKEEIIYDHDDYPSSRSNDSNDGGNKRELAQYSDVVTSQNRKIENVKGDEAFYSNIRNTELDETGEDEDDRYDGGNLSSDAGDAIYHFRENQIEHSAAIGSPNKDDLESILRQRALENLKKFKGGLQKKTAADQKEKDDDVKQSSTAKVESIPHKEDRVLKATQVVDQINVPRPTTLKVSARSLQNDQNNQVGEYSKTRSELVQTKSHNGDSSRVVSLTKKVDQVSVPRLERNSKSLQNDRKIQDGYYGGTDSSAAGHDVSRPPHRLAIIGSSKEKGNTSADAVDNKSKPGMSVLRREPSGTHLSLKQIPTSQASPKDKQLVCESKEDCVAAENAKTLLNCSNTNDKQVDHASGSDAPDQLSCLKPVSAAAEQSSKELQGEAKESSQYEQKTMSVMRGGEMVQVSYKVYIPKKTPALARRQLRR